MLTVLDDLALSPEEVCGVLVGKDCGIPYNPLNSWNISLPNTPKPPVVPHTLPKVGLKAEVYELTTACHNFCIAHYNGARRHCAIGSHIKVLQIPV